jgi:hypothetical protein
LQKSHGLAESIIATEIIDLNGNGKTKKDLEPLIKKEEGRTWVVDEVYMGMPWEPEVWLEKFGSPERYNLKSGNPKALQMFYFESIDMSLIVNILKNEIAAWREGRAED